MKLPNIIFNGNYTYFTITPVVHADRRVGRQTLWAAWAHICNFRSKGTLSPTKERGGGGKVDSFRYWLLYLLDKEFRKYVLKNLRHLEQ